MTSQATKSGVFARLPSVGFVALVLAVLFLVVLLLGRKDDVPTAQRLRGPYPKFLVLAEEPTGVYGNRDIDSAVFTYRTTAGDDGDLGFQGIEAARVALELARETVALGVGRQTRTTGR